MSDNSAAGATPPEPTAADTPAAPPPVRIGNAERDAALQALGVHLRAGRLTPDEYSERARQISTATNHLQLSALFADLPGGYGNSGVAGPVEVARPSAPAAAAGPAPAARPESGFDPQRLVAIAGVLAVPLMLACGFIFDGWAWSWLFIFLPAVVAAVVRVGRGD